MVNSNERYIILPLEQELIVRFDLGQLIYQLKVRLAEAGLRIDTHDHNDILSDYIKERIEVAVQEHFLWSNPEEHNLLEAETEYIRVLEDLVVRAKVVVETHKEYTLHAALLEFNQMLRKTTYRNFANISRWSVWFLDPEYSIHNQSICYRYDNDFRLMELERLQDEAKDRQLAGDES